MIPAPDQRNPPLWPVWLAVTATFWVVHFHAGFNDFILDDWTNLRDFQDRPAAAILREAWSHPTRPLGMLALQLAFRGLGDQPGAFALLSAAAHALNLGLILVIGRRLGLDRLALLAGGLLFACWPTLAESVRWPTLIAGSAACALPFYLGALAAFLGYLRDGGAARLALGGGLYAAGVSCYEIGILLPGALAALAPRLGWRRVGRVALVCAGILALYAAWRATGAFGRSGFLLSPQFKPDYSPAAMWWNLRQFAAWWAGAPMRAHLRPPESAAGLALAAGLTLALALLARHGLRRARTAADAGTGGPPRGAVAFLALWFAGAALPCLVSYSGSRLMYLPAVAVALGVAAVASRPGGRAAALPALAALAGLFGLANHRTQLDWMESGRLQRAIHTRLRAGMAGWAAEGRRAVLIRTDGVQPERGDSPERAHTLGAALFLRGFALDGMQYGKGREIPVILDVECGLRQKGDTFTWHDRFRPEAVRSAPASSVVEIRVADLRARPASPPEHAPR